VAEVLTRVFQYLALLRAPDGVRQELYEDAAALSRLSFDFREHPNAFAYTSSLANMMHDYPLHALLLVRHHVLQDFDAASIRAVLAALTPDQAMLLWASHNHSTDGMLTEKWCAPASCMLTIMWWAPRCA
jgi:secreted Zn-dependent insulinase-like peptidase